MSKSGITLNIFSMVCPAMVLVAVATAAGTQPAPDWRPDDPVRRHRLELRAARAPALDPLDPAIKKYLYFDQFKNTDYRDDANTDAVWAPNSVRAFPKGQFPDGPITRAAQSLPVDFEETPIVRLRVYAVMEGNVTFELSADGGGHWQVVENDFSWTEVPHPGSDLVWRATLNYAGDGVEPVLEQVRLNWATRDPRDWIVMPNGAGDAPTIQAAVDSAAIGDTIRLAPGVYSGEGNDSVGTIYDVWITSLAGAEETIIDCGTDGAGFEFGDPWYASFPLHPNEPARPGKRQRKPQAADGMDRGWDRYWTWWVPRTLFSVSGVTIRGGGVVSNEQRLRVTDCVIEDGMVTSYSSAEIRRNAFRRSTTEHFGGVHFVSDNVFTDGGRDALWAVKCSGRISRNRIDGGARGIYIEVAGEWEIDDNEIIDLYGPGVCAFIAYDVRVEGNFIRGLHSSGVDALGARCRLIDNVIVDNELDGISGEFVELRGNTLCGNGGYGANLDYQSHIAMENSIVAFNAGGALPEDHFEHANFTCSNIFGNGGDDAKLVHSGSDNFSADPLFCDRAGGDYALRAGSPCLPDNSPCGVRVGALGVGCGDDGGDPPPGGENAHGTPPVARVDVSPNPFNPATTIRIQVPEAGHVTLEIFDVAGRRIERLLDDRVPAGVRTITWRAGARASGVYFARLRVGGRVAQRKMILLK